VQQALDEHHFKLRIEYRPFTVLLREFLHKIKDELTALHQAVKLLK
jgi:hypothetical protein